MKTFYLKPADGLLIPDPDNPDGWLPAEGGFVPDTKLYRRFLARGEAAEARPPRTPKAEKE